MIEILRVGCNGVSVPGAEVSPVWRQCCLRGVDKPIDTPENVSDLVGALAVASAAGLTYVYGYGDRPGSFQQGFAFHILRADRQIVVAVRQAGGHEEDQLGRIVHGEHVGGEFHLRLVHESNANGWIIALYLEVSATDGEVAARCHAAVGKSVAAILGIDHVHKVRFLALYVDLRLLDFLPQYLVLGKGYVNVVFLRVPVPFLDQAREAGRCSRGIRSSIGGR